MRWPARQYVVFLAGEFPLIRLVPGLSGQGRLYMLTVWAGAGETPQKQASTEAIEPSRKRCTWSQPVILSLWLAQGRFEPVRGGGATALMMVARCVVRLKNPAEPHIRGVFCQR
ncbi:hypothetical protein AW878_17845 [Bordetella pseudohinzii]|nr:hypothetical protein L540_21220 [Bordetella pseudohinzii]KXA76572.1 hypothetical protein AW878_17845 [Bordetella pseudohinzii]KXA81281.1 hypothetical protein AW877_04970 [Bordetella pseudohinzii]